MRVSEELVWIYLFRRNPVSTTLQLRSAIYGYQLCLSEVETKTTSTLGYPSTYVLYRSSCRYYLHDFRSSSIYNVILGRRFKSLWMIGSRNHIVTVVFTIARQWCTFRLAPSIPSLFGPKIVYKYGNLNSSEVLNIPFLLTESVYRDKQIIYILHCKYTTTMF